MKYFLPFGIILFVLASCNSVDLPKDVPVCMKKLVRESIDRVEEVWRFQYKNEPVYVIIAACCDQFTDAYSEGCKKICSPDGGISGNGDGQCADFYQQATGGELLWKKK